MKTVGAERYVWVRVPSSPLMSSKTAHFVQLVITPVVVMADEGGFLEPIFGLEPSVLTGAEIAAVMERDDDYLSSELRALKSQLEKG